MSKLFGWELDHKMSELAPELADALEEMLGAHCGVDAEQAPGDEDRPCEMCLRIRKVYAAWKQNCQC